MNSRLGYKHIDAEDALYEAVTLDQVKAAANKYLNRLRRHRHHPTRKRITNPALVLALLLVLEIC